MNPQIESWCCFNRLKNNFPQEKTPVQSDSIKTTNDTMNFVFFENICNQITEQRCQQILYMILKPQTSKFQIVLIIIFILLFLIGSTGNICVILCVTLFRNMRTISHVFLLNLACSDLLVFLICEPFTIASLINPDWIFGESLCRLNGVFQGTSVGVSILTLTSVCIERYIVIVGKGFNQNRFNFRHLICWVVGIWITSFLITSPLLQAYEVKEKNLTFIKPTRYCMETWSGKNNRKKVFTTIIFILFYLLPLIFMLILYSKVGNHLRRSTNTLINIENKPSAKRLKTQDTNNVISTHSMSKLNSIKGINNTRQRISKLLMILTLLFAIFWLPYHVTSFIIDFIFGSNIDNNLESFSDVGWLNVYVYPMTQILAYVNNAINPLCTLIISKKFRTTLNQMRKCQFASSSNSKLTKTLYYSQTVNYG
uniref:GCR368 n=1 Tax=Schmidtea mediterranea TaxID=79327 RepID=A0A193KUQ5_SCHMD|nr:GCR368 [Schmidtea mediterranea]